MSTTIADLKIRVPAPYPKFSGFGKLRAFASGHSVSPESQAYTVSLIRFVFGYQGTAYAAKRTAPFRAALRLKSTEMTFVTSSVVCCSVFYETPEISCCNSYVVQSVEARRPRNCGANRPTK